MNLRQFDLNLLIALDVLLTERNVTRAAERLFLGQPALSGMLARLRQAFGDESPARVGRSFELTEFAATPLLAIVPRRLGERMRVAADLRLLELPFAIPPLREKLAWHQRLTTSPAHAWMRTQIVEVAAAL